jgi:hypothetical protein
VKIKGGVNLSVIYRKYPIVSHVKKGCRGEGVKKNSINSTLVTMCEKGVSGRGVNIKFPMI